MMVSNNARLFDDVAKLMNDAAGIAGGVRREVEALARAQAERFISEMDLVHREDFEAVKDMAANARAENEELKKRIEALEAKVGSS